MTTNEQIDNAAAHFDRIPIINAAKRCGAAWIPWMGDWFTSWSPNNSNNNAAGTWDHWVDLALKVLKDPLTALVRPDAHEAVRAVPANDFYDESHRTLTDEELRARFTDPGAAR